MNGKKKITDSKNSKMDKSTIENKIVEKEIENEKRKINILFMKKNERKNISYSVINLFYEEPNIFFQNHKSYLLKTSFFDCCDISIFSHYFYILYENYKAKKNKINDIKSVKFFEIYNNNFNTFFTEYKNNLLIQDCYLDTAFHKLAKLRDKNFFFEICKRLLDIKVFNNEILSIKNFAEETCFNYIIDDISNNYLSLIKKNDYLNYKNFLTSFPDLIEKLTYSKKAMIRNFNLGIYFDMVNFSNIYDKIIKLINNNIYSFLLDYYKKGINYLNYLFQLCNTNNDYNKLLNLINEYLAKNDSLNKIIYNHIGYVLRKMNSYKKKGEKEINYGNNIICTFLENNFKNKTNKEIYPILFHRKIKIREKEINIFKEGIIYNLLYNQNINFDKKTEIFDILKKTTNLELEKEIKLDFIDLYKFFKFIQKNKITKSNMTEIYKENEFIKNIFAEFIIYIYLYNYIKILCEKTDKKNYNQFINEVNNYMNISKPELIKNYKLRHGLSNEQIKKILDLILFCIENNIIDDNDFKDNKIALNIGKIKCKEEIIKDFILSNEQLVLTSLKYIIQKDNNISYTDLLEIIFNCKYDLTDFINENKNDIIFKIKLANSVEPIKINKNINLKNINNLGLFIEDYQKYSISCSFKDLYKNAKANNTPFSYYFFFLLLSDNFFDLNILADNKINFIYRLKSLIKKNFLFFLNDWDKPYDYSEILNEIESNILQFSRILIDKDMDTPEENTLKINFFFDFLSELKPESKNKFDEYKNMVNFYHSSTSKRYGHKAVNKNILNKFYLLLILIYTKIKYGDYNPEILFLFMHFYKDYRNILLFFINCINENKNNNEIKNHFFMGKFSKNNNNIGYIKGIIFLDIAFNSKDEKTIDFLLGNLKFFFNKYLSDLYEIKYSLVFDYLTEILTNNGKYEKEKKYLYPTIIFNIGQNEKINKIILEKIYSSEISFYEFLKVEYDNKNENKFRKIIHLFDKMAKNEVIKSNFIYPDININNISLENSIDKKNIFLNLYLLFQGLKKKNIPLYDCINSNFIFLKDIVYLLYYIHDIICEKIFFEVNNIFEKNSIEKIEFITEEIYDFFLSFCLLCKNSSNNLNLLAIKENIKMKLHIDFFTKVFYKKINNLNNKNSINIEYDKFIDLIKFYFSEFNELSYKLDNYLKNILIVFIEKNPEKFIDVTKFISRYFNVKNNKLTYIIYDILINIIKKDLDKYKPYLSEFLSLIKDYSKLDNYSILHKKSFIINYLLRNTEYKDEINIFKNNLDPNNNDKFKNICFQLLNYINDKDMSLYLFFQIRNTYIFVNEENFLFLIFENGIQNEYIIDYLLNFITEERQKIFFEENKTIIIKSLFLYGQINGYIYIQKIFKFIKKFLPINEFKNIIYPLKDIEEEIFKSVNYLEEPIDDFFKSKEKYLFYYCLAKRRILNYETIATIFEYCPKTNAILDLCPFLNNNLENILKNNKIIKYLEYFKKEKNRILIRKLSTSFYNLSLFLEIIFNKIKILKESNDYIEKLLFFYFVKINILEITPDELLIFFDFEINEQPYDNENYDPWFIDELLNKRKKRIITEKNIFIIFAFYELKGLPIISIKNYVPDFYSKIEKYYQKFKKLDIPNCCLKKPFDINIYDKLKFIIANKTNKLLNYLYEHYPLFNLIFIIEKENNLLLNLSSDNKNYLVKILYNLLQNNDIESQINDNNYEKFMKAIRSSFGCNEFESEEDNSLNGTRYTEEIEDDLFGNNIMSNTLIKDCILTLKNFNVNVSILIEKCFVNYFFNDIYNYLSVFKLYLRIILNVCNHIIFNELYSKDNNNDFNILSDRINVFNIFNNYNEKFKIMKNTIDIRQINYLILKNYEEQEMKNGFELFEIINNWMINYIESKEIVKIFNDLEKEKFTYLTYFKYLRYICMIIINFLKRIEDIDYKKINYINKNDRYNIKNFKFILEKDKNKAKELLSTSLFNLGNEIWNKIDNKKDKLIYESPIYVCYYFNEEKKEYVETYTDIILIDFVRNKIFSIFSFIKNLYVENLIQNKEKDKDKDKEKDKDKDEGKGKDKDKNKNKDKDKDNKEKNLLVYEIKKLNKKRIGEITEYLMPENCNNKKINNILEILDYNKYKDFISSYLEASAYDDILIIQNSPQKYFYNLYYSYIHSYFYFNNNLLKYCKDLSHFEKNIKYETFIDLSELIKSIRETEFHKNEKLNEYFQIKAINYLINNDNSLIYIFINEAYKLIHDEMIYRRDQNLLIKEKFKIIVNTGYNYNSSYINKIIDNYNKKNINKIIDNYNKKNIKEKKEKSENKEIKENNIISNRHRQKDKNKEKISSINEINNLGGKKTKLKLRCNTEENNKIKKESNLNKEKEDNNIVSKNNYKRKNIPIINYAGYIPQSNSIVGISQGLHLANIFGNEIIIEKKKGNNKLNLLGNGKENKKTGKKLKVEDSENIINIFNLIFKISNLNKKEIIINQYDISKILEPYLEEDKFINLINNSLNYKTKVDDIPKYWSKHLNLAFIYSKLGYDYTETY